MHSHCLTPRLPSLLISEARRSSAKSELNPRGRYRQPTHLIACACVWGSANHRGGVRHHCMYMKGAAASCVPDTAPHNTTSRMRGRAFVCCAGERRCARQASFWIVHSRCTVADAPVAHRTLSAAKTHPPVYFEATCFHAAYAHPSGPGLLVIWQQGSRVLKIRTAKERQGSQ